MRRKAIILLTVTWLMLGMDFAPGSRAWAASEAATLKSVTLSASPTGTELVLRVDGIYSYKTIQASPDTLFIDLAGAKVGGVDPQTTVGEPGVLWLQAPVVSGCLWPAGGSRPGGHVASPTLRRSKGRLNTEVGLRKGSICQFGGCPRVR